MLTQLIVLFVISCILYSGNSLRHFALAGDGCSDCNCGSDGCCDDSKEKGKYNFYF